MMYLEMVGLSFIALVWVAGWIMVMFSTEGTGGWFWKYVLGPLLLFFIWPYIAWCMARQF